MSVCTKCDTGSPSCASNQSVRGKETVGMSVFTVQYNVDSRNVSFYCAIQRITLVVQVVPVISQ